MADPAPERTMPRAHAPAQSRGGWVSFTRMVGLLRPWRREVALSGLLAVAVMAASLSIPWLTGLIIDDLEAITDGAGDRSNLAQHSWLLLAAAVIRAFLWAARRLVAGTISLGLEQSLRTDMLRHLSGLSFRFFDRHQTGQLLSRITSDVSLVRYFLGYGAIYFFTHLLTLISVSAVVLYIEPRLALVVYAFMPFIVVISVLYSRRSHPVLKEIQQREADVTAAAEENIVGGRVVRAFAQERNEIARFNRLARRIVDGERTSARISATWKPLYQLIPNLATAGVMLFAAASIERGTLTIGEFFAFYLYLYMLVSPLRIIGSLVSRAQRAVAASERIFELLDADERLPTASSPRPLPTTTSPSEITFDHVSFQFLEGRPVLDDVTLTIPAGSTVALLGPTGSGKTTLASLIPRLYDPDGGRVLLDGVDIREYDLHAVRRSIGIVDQEPFLFSATVADNIRFGNPDASLDQVRAAAEAAQAAEFIERLPNGYDTVIGERGLTLSGGQRQRLAIARALLVDPRVLVLDDATASVDSRIEQQITSALGAATAGRTTVLIAHRPSTIQLADHIVMLDAGRIADQGTHDELLARNTLYQQIHEQKAARREFLIEPEPTPDARGDEVGEVVQA